MWTARTALRVCVAVSNGVSITNACKQEGRKPEVTYWRRRAEDGEDPFWTWFVSCLDVAEASFIGKVEKQAGEVALDPDSKHYAKIAALILTRRSADYKPAEKEVSTSAGHTSIENLFLLIQGGTGGPTNLPTILQRGYATPAIEDKGEVIDAVEVPKKFAMSRRTKAAKSEDGE